MSRILKKVLLDLTTGLEELEARKSIFINVRDIEYMIVSRQFSKDQNEKVTQVLTDRKGFCLSKHYLLGELFREAGYDVKYCTYAFRWEDSGIKLPAEVLLIARKLPITFHVAIKVFIEGVWVLLDVSWDKSLEKSSFPVNGWDGVSNTVLAVKSIKEFEAFDIDAHHIFYRKKIKDYLLKEKVLLARFTKLFNKWISEIRMKY